ncbi:MAG TPA: FlgD immunoglobulin-like domain containing protein, partial [Rhodothermales bacterium]|nr:FlgD immunoglobulin-like domain containing protein [Rhodothermales bacterium]
HGNYPNPFNPETIIRYDINQAGHVQLRIYDGLGREVATLVDATKTTGLFQERWDGRDATGRRLPSGVYFYRLILDQQPGPARVMTLLK